MSGELTAPERRTKIVRELRSLANQVQCLPVVYPEPEERGEELPIGVKFLGATGCCWIYYEPEPHGSTFEPTREQVSELLSLVSNWFRGCAESGSFCTPSQPPSILAPKELSLDGKRQSKFRS